MAALVSSAWEGVAETNPERLAGAISICGAVQVWARAAFSQMQEKWGVISSHPPLPRGWHSSSLALREQHRVAWEGAGSKWGCVGTSLEVSRPRKI